MNARLLFCALLCSLAAWPQKYTGPMPPKPDLPYLLHADTLVATENTEAKEQKSPKKEEITYIVPGAASSAKTPLASPILLFQSDKLSAEKLQMYKLEARNGNREITFSNKKKNTAKPINISVNRVAEGLYRIEATDSLPNGEYALTPEGSNQVFCFQIY